MQLTVDTGDFSFARSLVTQYKCRNVLATCYDDKETLRSKYPQSERKNIPDILNVGRHAGDQQDTGPQQEESDIIQERNRPPTVLYSVDARKLGSAGGGGKEIRNGFSHLKRKNQGTTPSGPWDKICFNFPHVGGLSTDVNRQVRSNQELLVGFFKAAVPLLSVPNPEDDRGREGEFDYDDSYDYTSDEDEFGKGLQRTQPGQILVTLFEGEPYTLWNIKDLARHTGLRVVTSFRFPWSSYEGYAHARTLGEVEGKQGGRGGWKGEDREARMYVFENAQVQPHEGKKRGRPELDSDSDSD